jgi:putative ABC transport system permease protein
MLFMYVIFFLSNLYKHAAEESKDFALDYAAVAVVRNTYPSLIMEPESIFNDRFLQTHSSLPYVTGYYAFSIIPIFIETIIPVEPEYNPEDRLMETRINIIKSWLQLGNLNFHLVMYTDISLSTHFRLGNRKIIEGRFADNLSEANISRDLAELNQLTIGDTLTFPFDAYVHTLEIVGIYEDFTPVAYNETELILNYWKTETNYIRKNDDSFSRNQILTTAPSSRDIVRFTGFGHAAYSTVVYYVDDVIYIPRLIEAMTPTLHYQHATLDTLLLHNYIQNTYDQTARNALTILIIFGGVGLVSSALLIVYILKSRAYDIGVFRSRGLPRVHTAGFITLESLIVSFVAFVAAMVLHTATFEPVASFMHSFALQTVTDEYVQTVGYSFRYVDLPQFETFSVGLGFAEFALGLAVILIWVTLIGFLSTVYITRFEPIKVLGR